MALGNKEIGMLVRSRCNKSSRERQIPYNFIYMWNLRNETKQTNKQNRNKIIDTENIVMVVRLGEVGG